MVIGTLLRGHLEMPGQCVVVTMTGKCFWHSVDGVQSVSWNTQDSLAQAVIIMSRVSLVSSLKTTWPNDVIFSTVFFIVHCLLVTLSCWRNGGVIERAKGLKSSIWVWILLLGQLFCAPEQFICSLCASVLWPRKWQWQCLPKGWIRK